MLFPQPPLDPVEEVEEDGDQVLFAEVHEMADLEDLKRAGAEAVLLGVEQPAQPAGERVVIQPVAELVVLQGVDEIGEGP